MSFKRPRRVHAGKGGGTHKRAASLPRWAECRRDRHDVVGTDERDKTIKGGTEGIEQLVRRGMVRAKLLKPARGSFTGSSSLASSLKCC